MHFTRVKIITTVPSENAEALRAALGRAGAGNVGNYRYCSFSSMGKGRFMPTDQANPYIGEANELEVVDEERIEVICERAKAKEIVAALRKAHPYEEPIVDIMPLLDEGDL